ncbi:MAG: aromatic ring-hydroxylating dioxygenase subunit alpha [Actinomycetota bacterium]|nr:aromatic ring-hydroxylating dioxygenase subunit alpha [Actinomycetota bacterium]
MDDGDRSPGYRPPSPSSPPSVVRLPRYWYVACASAELGRRPVARTILGIPLVLFRDGAGRPVALLDRCPHRNVPLSCGQVVEGLLECCYHGWRFDPAGACRAIPGLVGEDPDRRSRRATVFPVAEQDGFVWVVPDAEASSSPPGPFRFPHLTDPGYATVRRSARLESTLHAALENTLDVPHTAFLHGGLFRGGREPVEIEVVVRHRPDSVEAEYVGEPRPEGLAGRVLAPEGGLVTHFDRFFLPSIAQVEYRLGENHLVTTSAFTPVSDFVTDLHAAVTFRLRLPHAAVRAAVTPIVGRILSQDAAILRRQSETIRRFGGEQFSSTDLDVLGQHIWKLLRQAERGQRPGATADEAATPPERRIRIRV